MHKTDPGNTLPRCPPLLQHMSAPKSHLNPPYKLSPPSSHQQHSLLVGLHLGVLLLLLQAQKLPPAAPRRRHRDVEGGSPAAPPRGRPPLRWRRRWRCVQPMLLPGCGSAQSRADRAARRRTGRRRRSVRWWRCGRGRQGRRALLRCRRRCRCRPLTLCVPSSPELLLLECPLQLVEHRVLLVDPGGSNELVSGWGGGGGGRSRLLPLLLQRLARGQPGEQKDISRGEQERRKWE